MRELVDYWVDLRSASRSHLRVRLVALAGAVLFMLSFAATGGGQWVSWSGLVLLGALCVYHPTALFPVLFCVFAIVSWWAGVPGPWHWALLPAALGLLLVHASAALASSVPAQAPLPASVTRLYAVRTGLVAGLTVLMWLGVAAVAGVGTSRLGAVPGIVGLAVLAAFLLGYQRLRRTQEEQEI